METPSTPEREFLTVAEVASMLRVTPMTVYRLIHSHRLTAVQIGRQFRVPVAEAQRVRSEGTS